MGDPMTGRQGLDEWLADWAAADRQRREIASVVLTLSRAANALSDILSRGALSVAPEPFSGGGEARDGWRSLDLVADQAFLDALGAAPVAGVLTAGTVVPAGLRETAGLLAAVNPIDAWSGFGSGMPTGTTFSILDSSGSSMGAGLARQFLQPGSLQRAAGLFLYGPFTALALTVGEGAHIFTLDRARGRFFGTAEKIRIPPIAHELAVDFADLRPAAGAMRTYVDDCLRGRDGPRDRKFSMHWTGSPVADVWRVLTRGGLYIAPGDPFDSGLGGGLHLVLQANPIAFLIEQAGGTAAVPMTRCLDVVPEELHQRTPLVAGSPDEVDHVVRLYSEPAASGEGSQLFRNRGLFLG